MLPSLFVLLVLDVQMPSLPHVRLLSLLFASPPCEEQKQKKLQDRHCRKKEYSTGTGV
jgi:hypothetical protein